MAFTGWGVIDFRRFHSRRYRFSSLFLPCPCSFYQLRDVSRRNDDRFAPPPFRNLEPRPADDLRADVLVDEEPSSIGRQDLGPWQPAFALQLVGEGAGSPGGAEGEEEREDPPSPLRRAQRGILLASVPILGARLRPCVGGACCGVDAGEIWQRPLLKVYPR